MNTRKCFVTLVDLLGFSAVVMAENLATPVAMVRRFQKLARSIVAQSNAQRAVHGLDRGRRKD
jgi:hypothetical protein